MDEYSPKDHHLDMDDLIRHASATRRVIRLHPSRCPGRQSEDRLREMLREHELTYHSGLPTAKGEPALPIDWSTVGFVALISRAVARAVEVAIRVHRESSQLHRLEDGQARGFDARILAGTADQMPLPLLLPALGSPEWVDLYRN